MVYSHNSSDLLLINLLKWSPVLNDRSFPSMCISAEKNSRRVKGLSHRNLVKDLARIEIAIKHPQHDILPFYYSAFLESGLKHRSGIRQAKSGESRRNRENPDEIGRIPTKSGYSDTLVFLYSAYNL